MDREIGRCGGWTSARGRVESRPREGERYEQGVEVSLDLPLQPPATPKVNRRGRGG